MLYQVTDGDLVLAVGERSSLPLPPETTYFFPSHTIEDKGHQKYTFNKRTYM